VILPAVIEVYSKIW